MSNERKLTPDEQTRYLLSFLVVLVHRAGGELTISNLSEFSGKNIVLGMELLSEQDKVILRTKVREQ